MVTTLIICFCVFCFFDSLVIWLFVFVLVGPVMVGLRNLLFRSVLSYYDFCIDFEFLF